MSLGRATGFNKHTVETFFKKLGEVLDKYEFAAKDIYNFDESGIFKYNVLTLLWCNYS